MKTWTLATLVILLFGACTDDQSASDRTAHIFVATECDGAATLTATSEHDRDNPIVVTEDCDLGGVEAEVGLAGRWMVAVSFNQGGLNCVVDVPQDAIDAGETIVACE